MSDSFYCMTKTHVREKIYLEVSFSRTKEPRLKRLPFDLHSAKSSYKYITRVYDKEFVIRRNTTLELKRQGVMKCNFLEGILVQRLDLK